MPQKYLCILFIFFLNICSCTDDYCIDMDYTTIFQINDSTRLSSIKNYSDGNLDSFLYFEEGKSKKFVNYLKLNRDTNRLKEVTTTFETYEFMYSDINLYKIKWPNGLIDSFQLEIKEKRCGARVIENIFFNNKKAKGSSPYWLFEP